MFIFLFTSMLTLAFHIQPVKATGTIYIRADGSIEGTANIQTADNVTYVLTANINDSIIVERNSIVIDGNGYTLQGTGSGTGIDLSGRTNVTVRNTQITGFDYGIYLATSSNNSISGNNITDSSYPIRLEWSSNNIISENKATNNWNEVALYWSSNNIISENNMTGNTNGGIRLSWSIYNMISGNNIANNWNEGIHLDDSPNNSISGNNITNNYFEGIGIYASSSNNTISRNIIEENGYGSLLSLLSSEGRGIWLSGSSDNLIYHNSFINNSNQVLGYGSTNKWDNGYPSGGNYWSDYNGTDFYNGLYQNETGTDGIGDKPYVIDADNRDNYPLMHQSQYVPIAGNLNLDGTIDISDAILAGLAFGSYPGHPRWNELADLNKDNVVDIFDVIILANNFGKYCT